MDIFLLVDQIHGTAWKKKKLKKREDACKSITLHFLQTGKSENINNLNMRFIIVLIIYLMSWREVTVIFFDLSDFIPSKQA